jgi:hypothetical protein
VSDSGSEPSAVDEVILKLQEDSILRRVHKNPDRAMNLARKWP